MRSQYAITLEIELIRKVDEIVKKGRLYASRNEFIREAVRDKVSKLEESASKKELNKIVHRLVELGLEKEVLGEEKRSGVS